MDIEIIRHLKVNKDGKEYILKEGSAIQVEFNNGEIDVVQIVTISEKSISVGSYMTPEKNPYYIKLKNLKNIIDVMNDKDEEIVEEEVIEDGEGK